jgi:predicted nucleic acid-binding protein
MHEGAVVCNTSPLLYLYQVRQVELLGGLYGKVLIPPAVREELQAGRARGVSVPELDRLPWLEIEPLRDSTLLPAVVDLGAGESEAIALALSHPGSLLVLDDALGRRIARLNRIQYTGTLGILVKAKQRGLLPSVSPVLNELQKTNMWLSRELVSWVLRESGEG